MAWYLNKLQLSQHEVNCGVLHEETIDMRLKWIPVKVKLSAVTDHFSRAFKSPAFKALDIDGTGMLRRDGHCAEGGCQFEC